jgi:hypothetical protein
LLTAQLQRLAHSLLLLACRENRSDGFSMPVPSGSRNNPMDGHGRRDVPLFRVHDGKVVRKMTAEVEQRQARDVTKARVAAARNNPHHYK